MVHKTWFLAVWIAILASTPIFAQTNKITAPQPNEERYDTEDFGNCTFAYGKDRSRYIQPYVTCKSGDDAFSLIPQEDGKWAILITPGDETERSDEEARSSSLAVSVKVDDNDPHELSFLWPKRMNMALQGYEIQELARLLDELRKGESMTISRNDEVIEYDLSRANQAFPELVFEQLIALSKVEKSES